MAIKRKLFQFDEQYNPNQDLGFGRDDEFVDNILSDNLNTGGGGTKVSIIKGCMDTSAINYNPSATTPNNSVCKYDTPKDTPNATILLSTTSNRNAFDILFNSKNTEFNSSSKKISLTAKECIKPVVITVKQGKNISDDSYRISSKLSSIVKEIKPLVPEDIQLDYIPVTQDYIKFDQIKPQFNNNLGFNTGEELQLRSDDLFLGFTKPFIKPQPKPIPRFSFGTTTFSFYEFLVEKRIDGTWVEQPSTKPIQNLVVSQKVFSTNLDFQFRNVVILPDPTPIDIELESEIASDGLVSFRTSWGTEGLLEEDDLIKLRQPGVSGVENEASYVELFHTGDVTKNRISYTITYPDRNGSRTITTYDTKIRLTSGLTKVFIESKPIINVVQEGNPLIKVELTNFRYNIAAGISLKIPYSTAYSDYVGFTLGKIERKIDKSGTVVLDKNDFTNGLGLYELYLQPISEKGGTGEYSKLTINVFSEEVLKGPDITNINYPQNIKGADFKEYDVPFKISWQSVNTNFVKIYIDKKGDSNFLGQFEPSGLAEFKVGDVLNKLNNKPQENRNGVQFSLVLIPTNLEGNSVTEGKYEKINITFDKGGLKLRRGTLISDLRKAFLADIDVDSLKTDDSKFLTHYLHLGNGNNELVSTWGIDDETFSEYEYREDINKDVKVSTEKTVVLKLYEPLDKAVNVNDSIWVSKIQSIPIIDQITIIDNSIQQCNPLTPNFDLNIGDDIGYQILDDLITSGSTTSSDLVSQFVSSSNFTQDKLDITFVSSSTDLFEEYSGSGNIIKETGIQEYNWKDFVKYSSAKERVENFFYKVKLIENYQYRYNQLTSGSGVGQWTGSLSVLNEANSQLNKVNETKRGFDSFEKFLFTSSSEFTTSDANSWTYPFNVTGTAVTSSDAIVTSWYDTVVNSAYVFDKDNPSRLSYNLPSHITDDFNNSEYVLFFDMIGQHFDTIWTYIKGVSESKKTEHKKEIGVSNELVYHMLESLGWDADMGVQSQFLWEYAFGKHSDGTTVSSMSGKDRQNEVWRRLLNNLPYLYKNKGTRRAVHAALSCYGVPASLLTIMEFGGPKDPTQSGTTKFTFEDRTASIKLSGASAITVPWKSYSGNSQFPNTIEFRISTTTKQNQAIISGSDWSVNILKDTGSLAKAQLIVGSVSSSTDTFPLFNGDYVNLAITRTSGSTADSFNLYVKEGFQERLRTDLSTTLNSSKAWTSGSEIKIGSPSFNGNFDEFRLWKTPLSSSRIDNHALLPDAIDGNHVSASTEDLIFRNDFEYPKNRASDVDIKNVSLIRTYATSSVASGFTNESSYPYQYIPYDRDVTATVPSSGFNVGNKIRVETQTLVSDLNYKTRATKKSFDQAPIDSNKLGFFFSPTKEINMDILRSLGDFNIDNYIGDPRDEYLGEYKKLKDLRNYYFDRYSLNIYEYIQLVRYIDKSLFDVLESLVPARAKVSSGLLIEPHILERSKTQWKKPSGEENYHETTINVKDDVKIVGTNPQYSASLDVEKDVNLYGTNPQYSGSINAENDLNLVGEHQGLTGTYSFVDNSQQFGFYSGIDVTINAQITGSVQGQYDSTAYQQIGMGVDSLSVAGFGLFGDGSVSIRSRLINGDIIKDRVKVHLLKEQYSIDIPENIDSNDSSKGRQFVSTTQHRYKVNILPFTGSDGNESTDPIVSGDVVAVTPLNGYFPTHYRNTGDLTSGMENSFFNGSKQTSATTLDGGSPIVSFTTNPNTLKVSDSGRGSGEPILEVE
jgi:hypothetical protein